MALIIRISSKREERVGETNSSAFQVLEDEYLANARTLVPSFKFQDSGVKRPDFDKMSDQELAVWYNDNVILLLSDRKTAFPHVDFKGE